ncbi:hypothetical protein BCR44DRAFT_45305 [Catenaria anguillulae PL171]|uniref:Uncharacterized protein n=1 Tax=Catenaria anguillulae PL171 TaxID=765915 RepID=A0A1Y2HBN3_9FUNG|nr:hypothetical protein BCR44DRAFT_45305 [Catenaria anguillulae PL171]
MTKHLYLASYSPQSTSKSQNPPAPAPLSPSERTGLTLFFAQQRYLAWAHKHALDARRAVSNENLQAAVIPIQRIVVKDADVGWTSGAWLWDLEQAPSWFQHTLSPAKSRGRPARVEVRPPNPSGDQEQVRSWTPSRLRAPGLPTAHAAAAPQVHMSEAQPKKKEGKRRHRGQRGRGQRRRQS